jgi:syntaxin 5
MSALQASRGGYTPSTSGAVVRDRTLDFERLVQSKKQERDRLAPSSVVSTSSTVNGGISSTSMQQNQPQTGHTQSEFAKRASAIGLGIHSTSQKLQRLAQLAKRTSMFDDPAQEINELSSLVKHDIQALNQGITDLQTFLGGAGNMQSAHHSNNVVETLRNRLKDTTKEFKDVLTLRTDNLKVHEERKSIFASSDVKTVPQGLQPGASFLPQRQSQIRSTTAMEQEPLLMQQSQAMMEMEQRDSYMTSRQDALQEVESTIVELGTIFQQLSHMVHEQGEMAVRIDENVDDTLTQVEAGQAQLLKYLNTISGNRWLMLKVFGVIMACLIFFLMFIA